MTPEQAVRFFYDYGPIIWTVFIFIAVVALLVKAWPAISRAVHIIDIINELPARLDKIENRIGGVEREVTTNGGSSIKDALKRVEDHLYSIK
jgi:NADH:ubiquinone oxidoreductase subunit D